jgi:hypothetical protein
MLAGCMALRGKTCRVWMFWMRQVLRVCSLLQNRKKLNSRRKIILTIYKKISKEKTAAQGFAQKLPDGGFIIGQFEKYRKNCVIFQIVRL